MVGFGFKPRQLGLSGSQHRAANPCAGRPLSHYRPLLQSVNPSCDGRGTHNSGHLLCFMGLLCVSVSCLGTWYLSDLSIGNVWWMHAFLRLCSARGCLPWSASLVQVPSRPESVFILSFLPPAYHIPPSPVFFPLLSAHWPTLVSVTFIPLLRNLRSLFSLTVEYVHLGSPHFLLLYLYP